jgi:hypothetical protein
MAAITPLIERLAPLRSETSISSSTNIFRIIDGLPWRLLWAAQVLVVLLEARTNGRSDGSGVTRLHQDPSGQGQGGGMGALAIPAPRAGTHRWVLPMRQALADRGTPRAKGEPRWMRTALALLLALSLVVGRARIQADPSVAASAAAAPARAGSLHLGTVQILGSDTHRGNPKGLRLQL